MSFITDMFKPKTQPIQVVPQEVKVATQSQLARNVSRLVNLYEAKEQGDVRPEIDDEIKVRAKACEEFGHDLPVNIQMAKALQTKVIK
jgi:hypothetical protein